MKKLLSTKKNVTKTGHVQLKSDPPKRMVTSAWNIRNNSSNVSSILHPDLFHSSPEKSSQGAYKKRFLGTNTCYCSEKKIRPRLMSRPRTCLSLDDLRKRLEGSGDFQRTPLDQKWVFQGCYCKDDADDGTNSNDLILLKRFRDELESKCSCLKYTDSRKEYNVFRQEQNEEEQEEIERYLESEDTANEADEENEEETSEERYGHEKRADNYSISTIMGTRLGTTKTTITSDFYPPAAPSEHLQTFRNQHYFETHGVDDLQKEIPQHTCVHQFRLDSRLLPEAVNVDTYGRSRCSVCSKPMEGSTMQLSKSYFGAKPSSARLRNLERCSELGLVPRSVSLGGGKSRIELRVGEGERERLGVVVGKVRRPEYFNTFALRQQKMSC